MVLDFCVVNLHNGRFNANCVLAAGLCNSLAKRSSLTNDRKRLETIYVDPSHFGSLKSFFVTRGLLISIDLP